MLTIAILLPLAAALALFMIPSLGARASRGIAIGVAAVPLILLAVVAARFFGGGAQPAFVATAEWPWIPALGIAWRVGVDGVAIAIALMSALLFVAAIAWPIRLDREPRHYYAWMLFLLGVSLGVFLVLDLILFYVFFDLSLVGMYFLIGRWGHGDAQAAATKFFIYTLLGSLAILLAIIGLALSGGGPLTFDMRTLIVRQPLGGVDPRSSLILFGFVLGFAIKTPLFPVHTWLPPAHVNAPGPVSAILAGVLLKMGTYGLVRIPLSMMRETVAAYALPLAILALVSILWGAFVALAQSDLKRRIAYTSVNHMGYTVLGIAVAGALASGDAAAHRLALDGAVVEMVAHGLITGSLFLIAGAFWQRTRDYDLDHYGGLADVAPRLTALTIVAAFASLGLPALAGFVAEFQIFAGTFATWPWIAAIGLLGVLITAALFLNMLRRLFFGDLPKERQGFVDLGRIETAILSVLLGLVLAIGVYPRPLLALIGFGTVPIVAER
ncbi:MULTISPECIES: complex I subunit 4 family protein [Stakelama]|uniref:NADH dehydrogenase subunit M n=2 Tax=Stakelama TaxID=1124625 RepID=A0A4R6FU08_9SPHN|nr:MULTISPECIES: NADH-quinone oxidoreductase subunit M [Stakelama]MAX00398.1 oxidoreductase [Sphingomonas sp.]TDN85346.1 NADH dehydrogenase subunit M [Stakelama pacifica]WNO53522.1 NADH-quinone oxidoreductase subunit M [Stakelama sp. W311]GGO92919.1 oxidoreductase [Stakelama pacifica]